MSPEVELLAVVALIREYLAQNPRAEDTLDGICRSWLQPNVSDRGIVLRAVQALVADGTLTARSLPAGSTIYVRAGTRRSR